jgi:hypothetical protein
VDEEILNTDPKPDPLGLRERGVLSYLNPYNWGVDDFSSEPNFEKAFSKARNKKLEEFIYGNERYSVKINPLFDASSEGNFNSAFRKAREMKEPQFKFNNKVYKTDLVSKATDEEFKRSKQFIDNYIKTQPFSMTREDSLKIDPTLGKRNITVEGGLTKDEMNQIYNFKSEDQRQKSIKQFQEPVYTSITEQKGSLKPDGYYRPLEKQLFVYHDPKSPEVRSVAVHELAHKAGLIANEPVVKNSNNKRFFVKDGYLMDPYERAARHISALYYLNEKGHKFEKFGEKEYNLLREAEQELPYDVYQLMELYGSKNEFIKQMNIPLGYKEDTGLAQDSKKNDISKRALEIRNKYGI